MLSNKDCATRDELLFAEAKRFMSDKQKLIDLIDALMSIEHRLEKKGIRDLEQLFREYEVKGLPSGVLTKSEIALLDQVAERNHSIDYYLTLLEEAIGKEIRLYETISQQLVDMIRHRYQMIELIRHKGGTATTMFDRILTSAEPVLDHLALRHSILVPDLFVVLQNQKRVIRNRQWSRFKHLQKNEHDILRRLTRQVSLVDENISELRKWQSGMVPEQYYESFFTEERLPMRLVAFMVILQNFVAKVQKHIH